MPPLTEKATTCTTTCQPGQLCQGDECKPCPDRHFRAEQNHTEINCRVWNEKSENSHYVLAQNGTSMSDQVWKCAEGYQEYRYTVNGWSCIKVTSSTTDIMQTTNVATISSASSAVTSAANIVTTVSPSPSSVDMPAWVVALIVVVAVIAILLFIGLVLCWRKRWLCFRRCTNERAERNNTAPGAGAVSLLAPHAQNGYCFDIVVKLGPTKMGQFLQVLEDPSGACPFEQPPSGIEDKEHYFSTAFETWRTANAGRNLQQLINDAAAKVDGLHLLEC